MFLLGSSPYSVLLVLYLVYVRVFVFFFLRTHGYTRPYIFRSWVLGGTTRRLYM